jgi:hypothetical protein
MLLAVESDASYHSVAKGRSRAAGYFFLTDKVASATGQYKPNGAVQLLCHIMREVLSSAAEAKLGALFQNGKEACPFLRIALEEHQRRQIAGELINIGCSSRDICGDAIF